MGKVWRRRRILSPGGAGNTHDPGDLLQPAHDSLQLLAVGYIHGQRDQSEAVGGGAALREDTWTLAAERMVEISTSRLGRSLDTTSKLVR